MVYSTNVQIPLCMHMYTPTFLVQKAAKIKNCSGDRLREEARSKKPEARIQEAPAKVVQAVTHRTWRFHLLPMTLWQEQEARSKK